VNSHSFRPGDKVLFEAGAAYSGTLELNQEDGGAKERAVGSQVIRQRR
jgi:hypothetical protein